MVAIFLEMCEKKKKEKTNRIATFCKGIRLAED